MKKWLIVAAVLIVALFVAVVGYRLGAKSRDREVQDLATNLAKSEQTVEIQKNLYATVVVKLGDLTKLLDTSRTEVVSLKEQLKKTGAELLTTQQLVLKWKKAYEDYVAAHQSEEPGPPGSPPRKRVEFDGHLGPFRASGHTLTDPPEAYLKLEQIIPLILTVSVAQNKDGSWSSYVTSSDENVDVKVDLAGVNPYVLSPKWYQKFWVDVGFGFLGDRGFQAGISYHTDDDFSIGTFCSVIGMQNSAAMCGASLGVRIK